jgi:transposase-like protein
MAISKEVLDELMKNYKGPEDITGPDGLIKELTKALIERAMQGELTEHLGYEKTIRPRKLPKKAERNLEKSPVSDHGSVEFDVPGSRRGPLSGNRPSTTRVQGLRR